MTKGKYIIREISSKNIEETVGELCVKANKLQPCDAVCRIHEALCKNTDEENPDPFYVNLKKQLFREINGLDIGPRGFGGKTTALSLNIETAPTHITGLSVWVNIGCHVTRHAYKEI